MNGTQRTEKGIDMFKTERGSHIAAGFVLMALSAVPYVIVYAIERVMGAPDALASALWPTAVAPVLVGALVALVLLRGRPSRAVSVLPRKK